MLTVIIDEAKGIVLLGPDGPLSKNDFESAATVIDPYIFESAATVIDPYIEKAGLLDGLVIYTKSFPGWDSFSALSSHLKFVKEHHKKISRVAFATDSGVGNFAEAVASHFVNAEIKGFSYQELEKAKDWAAGYQNK